MTRHSPLSVRPCHWRPWTAGSGWRTNSSRQPCPESYFGSSLSLIARLSGPKKPLGKQSRSTSYRLGSERRLDTLKRATASERWFAYRETAPFPTTPLTEQTRIVEKV